jgi:hypothetical protein
MVGNFGWDFIYRDLGEEFSAVADWVGECSTQCDRLFRLPFHEPMAAFPWWEQVGLTGGTPRDAARGSAPSLADSKPPRNRQSCSPLAAWGCAPFPNDWLAAWPDWQFLTFDQTIPNLPNLKAVPRQGFRPVT